MNLDEKQAQLYNLLACDHGPMTVPQIAAHLGISTTTVIRRLDGLEFQGRVQRLEDHGPTSSRTLWGVSWRAA